MASYMLSGPHSDRTRAREIPSRIHLERYPMKESAKKRIGNYFIQYRVTLYYMSKTGFLLVGHGSKKQYNKELIETTADLVAEKEDRFLVKSGFMSINTPTVQEKLDEFKTEDIEKLVVVPLFLAKGIHILVDIPGILGLEEGSNSGTFTLADGTEIPLLYASPIGSDPMLADLMIKNADDVLNTISE